MQYEEIYLYLFIILTIYLGVITAHCIFIAFKRKPEQKYYYIGISLFTGFYMVARILLNYNLAIKGDPYYVLYQIASFLSMLGLLGLMIVVEKYIYQKLKYIPSLCILIFTALILIYPRSNGTNLITFWAIGGAIFAIIIPLLYLHVSFNSIGELRTKIFYIIVSLVIFLVGKGMNIDFLLDIFLIFLIMARSFIIYGLILLDVGII